MASIYFFSGTNQVHNLSGSGLGFYGGGFGYSVAVGSYQDTTFITSSAGTTQGPQCNNVQYLNIGSGVINSASSGVPLTAIPNYLAPLKIQFSHSSAVKTQNVKAYIYDRVSINNPASGVTCKVAEIIHPDTVQYNNGSGDTTWLTPTGSSVIVGLVASPGLSGLSPNGPSTTDATHDWFMAISASPNSIGSKTQFGLYVVLEYL